MAKVFLLSNSVNVGRPPLEHAVEALAGYLDGVDTVHFVPFARNDWEAYTKLIAEALRTVNVSVIQVAAQQSVAPELEGAQAIFIGGGNTFRLLKRLYESNLVGAVQSAVERGCRYIGSSAGSNVAGPTICTTNDMPIVQPPTFDSLDLVPFQINPHYVDTPTNPLSSSETREQRLLEYLEDNTTPIVALREGTWLSISDDAAIVEGAQGGARLFQRGHDAIDFEAGSDLSFLLT